MDRKTLMKTDQCLKNVMILTTLLFIGFFQMVVYCVPAIGQDKTDPVNLTVQERAWLNDHPVIRLAPDPEFKPIEFFDENGIYQGIAADYVRLIEKKLGIAFDIVHCENWDDVIARMKRHEVDVLNAVVKSPQRQAFMLFPTPYLRIPSVILVRKNVKGHLTLDMLKGLHIVMVSGYGYVDVILNAYPDLQIELVPDLKSALRKVSFGMADAFVGDLATASFYSESEGITNLRIAGETDPPNISGFAVRTDWPELGAILEKSVASLTDQEKNDIYAKWIHLGSEPGVTMQEFRNLMLVIAAATAFILCFFLIWNRTLKRMVHRRTKELQEEIEERQRTQAALSQSEAHFRTLLNTIPDLVWLKNADGVYLSCNTKFERFFGDKQENIIGKTDYDFVDKDLADFFRENDRAAMDLGGPRVNEETVTYADDGHQELLETIKTPVYGSSGKLIGVLGIARDITDRKRAEDERQKLQDELYQARKMDAVGRLAGGVAHDFNNMLSIIIGRAELARMKVDPSDSLFHDLTEIETVGKRSADLTRQLLAFARKQTISPEVLDLNDTIESMITMLRRLIGEGIDLIWKPGHSLWPVNVDPAQVNQLLANLIINARDAISGSVGCVVIETGNCTFDDAYCETNSGFSSGEFVSLVVSDDGCGMSQETMDNIFEPFFTTKELGKGTGLGLATIYGIAKQNDGFVHVSSEPGKGASFTIYLPRHTGEIPVATPINPDSQVVRGHETILLVEDEPQILTMARIMLESLGYTILATSKPSDAVQIVETFKGEIHVLMTDVVMPEMNGRDLANHLLTIYPGLKRLYMSGYTADVIAHHGVLDEGVHFIQKPFTRKELAAKIRDLLDRP